MRGFALTLVAVLSACASAYRLPPETVALRSTMDADKARVILSTSFRGEPTKRAGAYQVYLPEMRLPMLPRVRGEKIHFEAFGDEVSPGDEPDAGCKVPTGDIEVTATVTAICSHAWALRSVEKIRVVSTEGDAPDTDLALERVRGYDVFVHDGDSSGILLVNVPANELNPLLAALTYFSPTAELVEGVGF